MLVLNWLVGNVWAFSVNKTPTTLHFSTDIMLQTSRLKLSMMNQIRLTHMLDRCLTVRTAS